MLVLLVADLCMYLETLWKFLLPLSTPPPPPPVLHAPNTSSPSGKLQSQTKTLKHFRKLCSVCHLPPPSSSLLQCCFSHVTLQSHRKIPEVIRGLLARILGAL